MYVNSQISRKKLSRKRQTNNFRSVVTFSAEILGLWPVSRATSSIILSKQGSSPKRSFSGFLKDLQKVQAAN
jgi:hypothetical protein